MVPFWAAEHQPEISVQLEVLPPHCPRVFLSPWPVPYLQQIKIFSSIRITCLFFWRLFKNTFIRLISMVIISFSLYGCRRNAHMKKKSLLRGLTGWVWKFWILKGEIRLSCYWSQIMCLEPKLCVSRSDEGRGFRINLPLSFRIHDEVYTGWRWKLVHPTGIWSKRSPFRLEKLEELCVLWGEVHTMADKGIPMTRVGDVTFLVL